MKLSKTLFAILSSVLLTLFAISPAFAAVTITISGNGSDSEQSVDYEIESEDTLEQVIDNDIVNEVEVDNDTGNNEANDNTGGDVTVTTGDTVSDAEIFNGGSSNVVTSDGCGCPDDDVDVEIEGNGTDSESEVTLSFSRVRDRVQDLRNRLRNRVSRRLRTGRNTTNDNTGGDVEVETGDAEDVTVIENEPSANIID